MTKCISVVCSALIFCALSVVSVAHAQNSQLDLEWTNDFANDVRLKAERLNVPGFVFVVIEKGQTAKFYTYGRTERGGNKVDIDTVFRLASVSKTFTAALVASENQVGSSLTWQTPIKELTPEHSYDNYENKPILLRHVVGQSAGFMRNAYDNLIEANYSPKRVLGKFDELKPLCQPGYCYTYQNALFGVIDEHLKQQGSSFAEKMQSLFFTPLKMNASVGKAGLESSNNWAKPHVAVRKNRWAKVRVKDTYYNFSPAAGVNASAKDMSVWLRAMLLEHPDVVNREMITEMTLPRVQTRAEFRKRGWREHLRSAHYGLGWRNSE